MSKISSLPDIAMHQASPIIGRLKLMTFKKKEASLEIDEFKLH